MDKQLSGAKNEPRKESKRKRKRSKKPARAQSNETLESQMKNQESLACDEQNVTDSNEDSKLNIEGISQTVSASDTSATANISKELNPPDNEKMTEEETTRGDGNREECINKDVQQDLEMAQEQGTSEERESKSEKTKQDHVNNKKGKFAFNRSKKVKNSVSKSPDEEKRQSDPSGENTAVNTMNAEQHVHKPGGAKLETSVSSVDNEEASKFPEGNQEKPLSKNNKGKKLKQLASFGRNKKKYEIASKLDESSTETHEEIVVNTPGRFERTRSTSTQPFQTIEVVGNESKELVAADSCDFNNENTIDGKDDGTEIEKKRGGKQKKKGSVLGFKLGKSQLKNKPSKTEDEQSTECDPSKESDDDSATKTGQVEKNKAELERIDEDFKANETEAVDLEIEETSSAAAEMTQEVSNKERKMTVPPAQEDSNQVTPKKEKKENILRRRLRKLRSPGSILQGRKKSHEDENSVEGTDDGAKADNRESSEQEQTAEEQTPAAEVNDEEECSDLEGTSKAVKRKTSDLNSTSPALKKKKEDGENIIEDERNEEHSETVVTIVKEKDDQNIYEEVNVLYDLETVKDLSEEKKQSIDEVNKEMSQQKNIMEDHEESKQSKVFEEISCESPARDDDKKTEEEARRKSQKLMQRVINEFTEILKKKAEDKAAEIALQVEEKEERVEFSDRENTVSENQQLTSALDGTGPAHEPNVESYDSDVTVVTVKRLSSHESLVEHKTEPSIEDEIRAIAEEVSLESETSLDTEPPVENESKPVIKGKEARLETKKPQVTETREKQENEPNIEAKEMGAIIEVISKETESVEPNMEIKERPAIPEEVSSESKVPRDVELPKQETEDEVVISFAEEVSSGTETFPTNKEDLQVVPVHVPKKLTAESRAEHKAEPRTEGEEVHDINEAGESSVTEPNPEDSTVEASKVGDDSDDLDTITKANDLDERKDDEDEDVGQSKEESCLMESCQAPSYQKSVEEWIMVHRVDLTEEISRQVKHSIVFNSLRRSYTSCCTIM